MSDELRLLTVHAHADDETITMGGTLAVCADRGVRTCLVTCTDGELATIVDPEMDDEATRARLGEIRREELRAACAVLGVDEVHFLGYHDSGMEGSETTTRPEAFWMQPLDGVVERMVERIRAFRPHVVATYDAYGGYGHPDHVQAHRATLLAFEAAGHRGMYASTGDPWRVDKLYYTAFPRSLMARIIAFTVAAGMPSPFSTENVDELPMATPDELVTTHIDIREGVPRRRQALLAHRSQIAADFPLLIVPDEVISAEFGVDHYTLAVSRVPMAAPETDLFTGIETGADRR